jgi:hypothetical protein
MTEGEQQELDLQAEYGWFHVMRPRILKGLLAEVGETAWAVYTVIKCHANHHTGVAHPSQETIGRLIGKSTETVSRATKALIKAKLLTETVRGRHKEYTMLESAPVVERTSGTPHGAAEWQYVPKEFGAQVAALKSFIENGIDLPSGITLNLNVTLIQQRDHGSVTVNIDPGVAQRADMQALVAKLKGL